MPEAAKLPDLEGMDDDQSGQTATLKGGEAVGEKEVKGKDEKGTVQDVGKSSKSSSRATSDDKGAPTEAGAPEPEAIEAPKTWRSETKAKWNELPRWAQEEVVKRDKEIYTGIEQYRSKAEIGHAFEQAITPYIPVLRASGQEPIQAVQNLLQYQYALRTDPYNTMARLAQEYNVDVGQLAQMMGRPAQQGGQAADPMTQNLMQQISSISARLNQQQVQAETLQQQEADYAIAQFGADPKHEFFNDPAVRTAMGQILKLGFAQDMQTAYDKAVLHVPHVASVIQQRQTAESQSQHDQQRRQKAADAERASVDVVREGASSPFGDDDDDLGTILRKRYRQAST